MSAATPRKDPKPRTFNGEVRGVRLINKDPTKHYVFVNPADQDSFGFYEAIGYQVEEAVNGGVRLGSVPNVKLGDKVTYQGQILMSTSKDRRAEIEKEGPDGDSGSDWADDLAQRYMNKQKVQRQVASGFDPQYARAVAYDPSSRI